MIELKEQTVEAAEWLGADSEEVGMGGGSVNGATKKMIVVAVEETRSLLLTNITSPERPNSVLGILSSPSNMIEGLIKIFSFNLKIQKK